MLCTYPERFTMLYGAANAAIKNSTEGVSWRRGDNHPTSAAATGIVGEAKPGFICRGSGKCLGGA